MLQTRIRPFTATERERLEAGLIEASAYPEPCYVEAFVVGGLYAFFGLLLSLPIIGLVAFFHPPTFYFFIIGGIGILAGFVPGFRTGWNNEAFHVRQYKEHATKLAARLGRGEIMETTVTASAVVVVNPQHTGHHTGYFFNIGEGRVLFLWDKALSSAFTYTQYPTEKRIADLSNNGEPLKPSRYLLFEETDEYWSDTFYTGAIFANMSLATLENDLPYLSAAEPNAA